MNKQQFDQQISFVKRELTRISQEVIYVEGTPQELLRVRQSRLMAELERLEGQMLTGAFSAAGSAPIPNHMSGVTLY
jgi:hypothetical protein